MQFLADSEFEEKKKKKKLLNRTRTLRWHSTPTKDGQWPDAIVEPLINTNYFFAQSSSSSSAVQNNFVVSSLDTCCSNVILFNLIMNHLKGEEKKKNRFYFLFFFSRHLLFSENPLMRCSDARNHRPRGDNDRLTSASWVSATTARIKSNARMNVSENIIVSCRNGRKTRWLNARHHKYHNRD